MSDLTIKTPEVFEPLLKPARWKGAKGGRGSGKSTFFADMLIEHSMAEPGDSGEGLRSICIREIQKDLAQSSKALLESRLSSFGLNEADGFKKYRDVIQTPKDGLIIFKGMNDYTSDSIKSLENFKRAWWEEAQGASLTSINLLSPTLRVDGSELWFSWNPRRKSDAIEKVLCGPEIPTGAVVVTANWRDNPYFTHALEQERLDCLRIQPEQYDHIWEGGYAQILEGAYYAKAIAQAKAENRIGRVAADPLMTIRLFADIGGTGARADAFAMWAAQFIGREIRVLDYYEAVGQPLATHLNWMRSKGYTPDKAQIWLPHDGASNDKVYDVSYQSALTDVGYSVTVVPNQGKGAASSRVESGRRLFPSMWFNQETTQPGIDALGWYHEKRDENRNIGLGPEHDWASHCFVGSTEVITRAGVCRFDKLSNVGEVLTPCGWKQYRNPRITLANARLVEVMFKDGSMVRCTPEHLFLTDSGWKSAESLQKGSLIQSTLTPSRSILMVVSTVCGLLKAIYREVERSFIGMFGKVRLVKYLPGAISTTRIATSSTTGFRTLSAYLLPNIFQARGMNQRAELLSTSPLKQEVKLLSGTSQKQEGFGISGTQRGRKAGQSGSESLKTALSAANSSMRLFVKAVMRRFTALGNARFLPIESVSSLGFRADVWDITVPDGEMFSLSNGAVVHNSSDAFGLMCVAYEEPTVKRKADARQSIGWMG